MIRDGLNNSSLSLGRFLGLGIGLRAIQRPDQDGFHVVSSARSSQREGMHGVAVPFRNLKVALAPLPPEAPMRCVASEARFHSWSVFCDPCGTGGDTPCARRVPESRSGLSAPCRGERLRMLACHAVLKGRRLIRREQRFDPRQASGRFDFSKMRASTVFQSSLHEPWADTTSLPGAKSHLDRSRGHCLPRAV